MPLLRGENKSLQRTKMFWEGRERYAARIGNWKYVYNAKGKFCFDLSKDISEQNDLSASNPEKLAELEEGLRKWQIEMEKAEPRGPFRDF